MKLNRNIVLLFKKRVIPTNWTMVYRNVGTNVLNDLHDYNQNILIFREFKADGRQLVQKLKNIV